jgi:hypothetical protein
MEMLFELLSLLGPTLVALLTVPIMNGLKRFVSFIDNSHPVLKQVFVVVIAFGLTKLGEVANVALPGELSLFTGDDIGALLSAGLSMAIHAGQKKSV